jgi:hypothetical protein
MDPEHNIEELENAAPDSLLGAWELLSGSDNPGTVYVYSPSIKRLY